MESTFAAQTPDNRSESKVKSGSTNARGANSADCPSVEKSSERRQFESTVSPRSVQISLSSSNSHMIPSASSALHPSQPQEKDVTSHKVHAENNSSGEKATSGPQPTYEMIKEPNIHDGFPSLPFFPFGCGENSSGDRGSEYDSQEKKTGFTRPSSSDGNLSHSPKKYDPESFSFLPKQVIERNDCSFSDKDDDDDEFSLPFRIPSGDQNDDEIVASTDQFPMSISNTTTQSITDLVPTQTQQSSQQNMSSNDSGKQSGKHSNSIMTGPPSDAFPSKEERQNHADDVTKTPPFSAPVQLSSSKSTLMKSDSLANNGESAGTNKDHFDGTSSSLYSNIPGDGSILPFALPLTKSDVKNIDCSMLNQISELGNTKYLNSSETNYTKSDPISRNSSSKNANSLVDLNSSYGGIVEVETNLQKSILEENCYEYDFDNCYSQSIDHNKRYHATSPDLNNQSINFSKLMKQADNNNDDKKKTTSMDSFTINPTKETIENEQCLPSVGRGENAKSGYLSPLQSHAQSILDRRRAITLTNLTKDSFQLCLQLSPKVSVRDVVDIVANPDMLRFWCEPISALVVTDHKGGGTTSSTSINKTQDNQEEQYLYPDVEECDDDVIVPPAEDTKKLKSNTSQQREEYDGEWIKASTPEIILPYAHTTFMDNCFKRVSTFLGFPPYGNVTMFIERNSAQVGFSLGPFKAGTMLSHKIVVTEEGNGQGVILMDEVTVVSEEEEEEDGWVLCSCIGSVLDITRSWYKASLDGYIDQTKASLRNLADLVEGGGEIIAHQLNRHRSIYSSKVSFLDTNNTADQIEPLLT